MRCSRCRSGEFGWPAVRRWKVTLNTKSAVDLSYPVATRVPRTMLFGQPRIA